MNKDTYENLVRNNHFSDLDEFNIEVHIDLKSVKVYGKWEEKKVFCIRTISDECVGIFPFQISPWFDDIKGLVEWWEAIKDIFDL